jgi:hypothetical protein
VAFPVGSTAMMSAYSVSIAVSSLDVEAFFLVTRLVVTFFAREARRQQSYSAVPCAFPWATNYKRNRASQTHFNSNEDNKVHRNRSDIEMTSVAHCAEGNPLAPKHETPCTAVF